MKIVLTHETSKGFVKFNKKLSMCNLSNYIFLKRVGINSHEKYHMTHIFNVPFGPKLVFMTS